MVKAKKPSSDVELVKGFQIVCHNPTCGPIAFVKKREKAEGIKAEHQALHETHEKAVLDKLKELGAQAEKGESTPADVKLRCPTCKADIGRMHDAACDVARCLSTGAQRAFDEHKIRDGKIEENHKCGRDVWTGYFPGEREAAQYGVPIMVLKEVGKWDEQEVAWVMPDNYQEIIQEKGLGPRISA